MTSIKQTIRWAVGGVMLASAVGLGTYGIAAGSGYGGENGYDSDTEHGEDHDSDDDARERLSRIKPAGGAFVDVVYRDECGACHMAYPPGLLPSASWRAIMDGLGDHFGENAELPADRAAHITAYLERHASERGDPMKHDRLLRGAKEQAPLRITALPFFKAEHDDIPRRMVDNNPKVRTFSRCEACHRDAETGRFDEDTVAVPGFGRWDD